MIKKTATILGLLLTIATGLFAQNNGDAVFNDYLMTLPYQELSEQETNSLLQMREEEKLARDVYLALYDKWNLNIFKNIAKSEQSHTDMVALLLEKYNLQDPFVDEYGVFTDTTLQALYTDLVNIGSESLAKGLFIGCTIEDLDIYDLEVFIAETDNEDIRTVYQNLMKGSRNHMRSFSGLYSAQGETYVAQYITQAELDQILSTENEKGFLDANGNPLDFNQPNEDQLFNDYIVNLPKEDLSEQELTSLMQMREEEKLARDVYLALYDKWNISIFQNIANSEQQHTDMVALLFQKYGLEDPFIDERGVFTDTTLQNLYNDLVATGNESEAKALFVGCTIEDLDIYDLQGFLAQSDNRDVRTVYQNLMKGSRNHMRSFTLLYSLKGETYTAQYITQDELDQILSSENERGFLDADGNPLDLATGVQSADRPTASVPNNFIVAQNYPNPFNPQTTIQFTLPSTANVSISVYDMNGRLVKTLVNNERLAAGTHSVNWTGTNENGDIVSSGMYLYVIDNGTARISKQMILLK